MESFILFFENLDSVQKLSWIIICIFLGWMSELSFPLSELRYNKWRHALRNFVFLACSIIINVVIGILTLNLFIWLETSNFGLFAMIPMNLWIKLLLSILVLDFIAQYVAHVMLHKIKWMWKFHLVHHSDKNVDVTTGTRHHPGDYLIREVFSIITILIFGIPLAFYLCYRILTILFTYFSHANIKLPTPLDRALNIVFVTPDMHKFHHHFERPWTDSNFGNIFSIWDRIFGTLVVDDPKKVIYGVDVLDHKDDQDVWYQMKVPFDKTIKTD